MRDELEYWAVDDDVMAANSVCSVESNLKRTVSMLLFKAGYVLDRTQVASVIASALRACEYEVCIKEPSDE